MYTHKLVGISILAGMIILSTLPVAEAELWDLIIEINIEKSSIISGESVIITGKVVDHAYKPIRGAEVLLRTGSDTVKVFTNPWGEFKAEFRDLERIGGTYPVNVIATWYTMTGMTTTSFDVKGDGSIQSVLEQELSTDEARKYLSLKEEDFEKNPIGLTLFKYYHGLLEKLIIENKENSKPNKEQIHLDKQRQIAETLKEHAIEEYNPGAGVYEGLQHEYYTTNLNPKIKELIINQLNFTKNTFEDAKNVREEILKNGGTYEEAQKAYLEIITIPKEVLEQFNQNNTKSEIKNAESD